MGANKVTNALLLMIALLLAFMAFRSGPIAPVPIVAAATPATAWQGYIPITALGDVVTFLDSETGDYLLYNFRSNTIERLGNIGSAQAVPTNR